MNLIGKFVSIKQSVNASSYSVSLITLSSLLRSSELSSLYSSSLSPSLSILILFTEFLLSVREFSVKSLFSSSVLFEKCSSLKNGLYKVGQFSKSGGRIRYCWVVIIVIYLFVIGYFLRGDITGDFIFLFLGIRLSGVTLTPVSYKRETSDGIFDFNYISFGADGSN